MLRFLLIFIITLIGLVVLVFFVGSLIPKKHLATRSAVFHQPRNVIWDIITDFEKAPAWRSGVKSLEKAPPQNNHPVWVEISNFGRLPLEVTEKDSLHKMVLTIADKGLPFGGKWTYELTSLDSTNTRLTITENGEIYNPFFRFMAQFLFGYHKTLETYLKDLGKKLGEEVIFTN